MRIIQMLPTVSHGDGVGNEALLIDKILREEGYDTHIYAEHIGAAVDKSRASYADELPTLAPTDILVYHLSIGSKLHALLGKLPCRKVFIYHNITPAQFFAGYHPLLERKCRDGIEQFKQLAGVPDLVLAVSEFNKAHLQSLGYTCPMEVLPIMMPFADYKQAPDEAAMKRLADGRTNILFVGRVAPNKKQEDVIKAFYVYHTLKNPHSRLILAGSFQDMESYKRELEDYCRLLGLTADDVVFTGTSSFAEILAYYNSADLFLCMSEHEGFCIPLVEAMLFHVPIIAYDACAVADTLGGGGVLLKEKDMVLCAEIMDMVITDKELQKRMAIEQDKQLALYDCQILKERFLGALQRFF